MSSTSTSTTVTEVIQVDSQPFQDQKPGTSGLRKKVKVFQQPNYLENFIQAIYEANDKPNFLVLGGDGRYFMEEAIGRIINVLVANGIERIVVPLNGILSTPAASALIKTVHAKGGIILTASHNPGGPDGDFGIKFNDIHGRPANEKITDKIYECSKKIQGYKTLLKKPKIDLGKCFVYNANETKIAVVDPVSNYSELISKLFNFKDFNTSSNISLLIDCMNGVMGPYALDLAKKMHNRIQVINETPLPDFGGKHPDPNLTHAKGLVEKMKADPSIKLGAAFDGDGDRCMFLGEGGFFVSPGDSLAIVVRNSNCIPQFSKKKPLGVARSFPTSPAVDRVCKKLDIPLFVTPTGWKYFGNLLMKKEIELCGEESFGMGCNHVAEKDGLWAALAWVSIVTAKWNNPREKHGAKELVYEHWKEFGRDYFARYDYEECDSTKCQAMVNELELLLTGRSLIGKKFGSQEEYEVIETGDFEYVEGSVRYPKQGLYVKFSNESRFILRLSGTGSSGATVRLYLNGYSKEDFEQENEKFFAELLAIALKITKIPEYTGKEKPDVIT